MNNEQRLHELLARAAKLGDGASALTLCRFVGALSVICAGDQTESRRVIEALDEAIKVEEGRT